ncbi:uncharacterized protein [Anomalospiza imberbis]|uniref:uncharacterized protein n=1 Tax=Anomalospiza imberbis TaxID=187417 RepID=UPI00358FBD81
MALALRLFLLLLLAVALPARAAQAAPLQARGADEHARKASPAAWLQEDFQPLKPPAGVSAGKTFQAPFLVAAQKPGSHRSDPPRERNKPTGDIKSLEASKHMDQMLNDLERRREMEGEAVLKAEFPGGSSGSLAAPAAGREAMPGTGTGDEHARKASPAAWLQEDFQPLKPPAGVSAGKTFQAPFLVAAQKPGSHRREMEGQAVLKAEFPRGSSGSLAASAAGREAMPGTVTGDEHARKASPAAWLQEDFQPLKPPAGVSAGKTFQAPFLVAAQKPGSHRRGESCVPADPTG